MEQNPDTQTALPTKHRQNVQSIYPVMPNQHALLLAYQHSEADPGCLQVRCRLTGQLDPGRFQRAWDLTVQRHELMRASIRSRKGKSPLLIVWKDLSSNIQFIDLSDQSASQQDTGIGELASSEILTGIDLNEPPTYRVHVCKLQPTVQELIWTFHHVFLDGWSTSLVLRDLLRYYERLGVDQLEPIPPAASYGDYVSWSKELGTAHQRQFWQDQLAGFAGHPKRFPSPAQFGRSTSNRFSVKKQLDDQTAERLNELIKNQRLTASSVASAVWALTLAELYEQQDVAFGVAVSGRSAPMEHMPELVGLFTNVIPVRVQIEPDRSLIQWIRSIRDLQFEMQPFEQDLLVDIEGGCRLERGRVLLESLLLVENFPIFDDDGELKLTGFQSGITAGFPLTICVLPDQQWLLRAVCDSTVCNSEFASSLIDRLICALSVLASDCELNVQQIQQQLAGSQKLAPPVSCTGETRQLGCRQATGVSHGKSQLDGPRNSTELKLTMIWQQVLGISDIRIEDNFFELGGRSLTAIRLLSKIEDSFGQRYSPAILLEYPTIGKLAGLIGSGEPPLRCQTLIRFNECNSGAPIVCVHAGGEPAMYFRFLASHFDDRPAVGLQSKGLEGEQPLTSIEQMAAHYLKQLDQMFGNQRLHLVGYCIGGAVALEMVRQLELSGKPAGSITMVDSGIKWHRKKWPDFLEKHRSISKALPRYCYSTLRKAVNRGWEFADDTRRRLLGDAESRRVYFSNRVRRASTKAFFSYEAPKIDTPILLIRSTHYENMKIKDCHQQWREHTSGGFSAQTIESTHENILLEPEVSKVAQILAQVVEGAE